MKTTTMASCRRRMGRRKRCVLLISLCIVLYLLFAWFSSSSMSIAEEEFPDSNPIGETRPEVEIDPKFNVLEVPSFVKPPPEPDHKEKEGKKADPGGDHQPQDKISQVSASRVIIQSKNLAAKNKSEDIEVVKNKTLSQLGMMGVHDNEKTQHKLVFLKHKWNLTVSFEDIGNIMKDTAFLNKLRPLDVNGPMLASSRNRTANFTLSMPIKLGFCDCWEHYCFCCVKIVSKPLHINTTTCTNFTFTSKTHELDLTFSLDGKPVHKGLLSADATPLLCLGSIPSVADMCVHFFNMTYKVDRMGMHKSQLLGCTDFSLNIYNKTISVFPVDCFQIPGDPNHHPKHEQLILPNFVP